MMCDLLVLSVTVCSSLFTHLNYLKHLKASLLPAATDRLLSFHLVSPHVCVCVIVIKCVPGDTYCSANYHRRW